MKDILVLTSWSFKDGLIQTYTIPYLEIIRKGIPPTNKIYLITQEQKQFILTPEEWEKVKAQYAEKNIEIIRFPFQESFLKRIVGTVYNFFYLLCLIFRKRIGFIHAFCTPAGALAYVLSVLTGKPLILDSYEPHAEAMVENGTWRKGFKFKLLFYLERKMSAHATYIISATEGMRDYALKKYQVTFHNFYVKPACVDLSLFSYEQKKDAALLEELGFKDKIVMVYAGKFGGIYLLEEAFSFFKEAQQFYGDKLRILLLTAHTKEQIRQWAQSHDIDMGKVEVRFVAHKEIPRYIGLGDIAVTPVKPVPTKRYCTPIKDGEYWALGLPVIITEQISDDSDLIVKEGVGATIQPGNIESYRQALIIVDQLIQSYSKYELYLKIRILAERYRNFSIAEGIYKNIYK